MHPINRPDVIQNCCRHCFTESLSTTVSRCLSTRNYWTRRWPWMTLSRSMLSTTTRWCGLGIDTSCTLVPIVSRSVPVYSTAFISTHCASASTHGGMSRLSWPGCLVTYRAGLSHPQMVIHLSTNQAWHRVISLIKTFIYLFIYLLVQHWHSQ